jgi:hypothetical protein
MEPGGGLSMDRREAVLEPKETEGFPMSGLEAVGEKAGLEMSTTDDGELLAGAGAPVGNDRGRLYQQEGIGALIAAADLKPGGDTAGPAVLVVGDKSTAHLLPSFGTASPRVKRRLRCFDRPGIVPGVVELQAGRD